VTNISSSTTALQKWGFPTIFCVACIFIAASNLRDGDWARSPVFVLAPFAVLVLGLVMFPRYFRRIADRVEDHGTYLLARHRGVEARIELHDIVNVSFVPRSIPQKVVLRLAQPSALGQEIAFIPKDRFVLIPDKNLPLAEELTKRALAARSQRAA
jgi:hypothetical protein